MAMVDIVKKRSILFTLLILTRLINSSAEDAAGDESTKVNNTAPYTAPSVDGLHWFETFDGADVIGTRWISATSEKYTGTWEVAQRKQEALVGDVGLLAPTEARLYGISTSIPPLQGEKDKHFVLQYEARFQDDLTCGGSYMKLFKSDGKLQDWNNEQKFVIMFGPDKCGGTNKVHFILQHKSPKTNKWEEKHLKSPPAVPNDKLTHLYTLHIKPDNTFDVLIDLEPTATGSLLTNMEPSVNPPAEIDDPADSKPTDWVDEAKMDDPESTKPDDWDESEPMQIKDPGASMPSGWEENEPKEIPDPNAVKPDDWDDEEDGDWEPPVVSNPKCSVGCGKWHHPMIENPKYKGKWLPPKIDNPAYVGEWRPRQVPNPDFFKDETPYLIPEVDAIGFDLWTMSGGLMFDNIVVTRSLDQAKEFAAQSFVPRSKLEAKQNVAPEKPSSWIQFLVDNAAAVTVSLIAGVALVLVWYCCFQGGGSVPPPGKPATKKNGKEAQEKQGEDDTKGQDESKDTKSKEPEQEADEKEKKQGGIDLSKED